MAVETPPFNSNLPPIAIGDMVEYIKNGKANLRTVVGFDAAHGILVSPPFRHTASPFPPTPGKVAITAITFRFPTPLPSPPNISYEQHLPHPEGTVAAGMRLVRSVARGVPQMWEALSKTHTLVTAQDALAFLFGDVKLLPRESAMYGEVPILHLYAANTVLAISSKYFTPKSAGKFVCNTPEQLKQMEMEEQALSDDAKIQKFLAAAQRLLWSKYDFKPNYPINKPLSADPYLPASSEADVYNIENYKIYISILQRHAMSFHKLYIQNPVVVDKLLAPLGLMTASHPEMYAMLERLGLYEEGSNYAVSRMNFTSGLDLLQPFPADIKEAYDPKLLDQVPDPDAETRKDLRKLLVYTIDSDSTVAIDDGLSLDYVGPNRDEWLYVHIADPTRWIYPNSPLDHAARARVSSIYLPERMEPMLPLEISRDLMSLLPSTRSQALTFAVRLDYPEGKVSEYKIYPSTLQNIKRLNYEEVDSVLNTTNNSPKITFVDELILPRMYELALKRRSYREKSGAYFTDSPRSTQVIDETNTVATVFVESKYVKANMLVEEMMVLCGEVSAMYAKEHNIPIPHRAQPRPLFESEEYSQFLRTLPSLVRTYEYIFSATRAVATTTPEHHYGVGLSAYSRVSSPIRRYYDILSHHQIKAHLRNQPPPFAKEEIDRIIAATQPRDDAIALTQRATERMWKLRYFESNMAKRYFGLVLRVTDIELVVMVVDVWYKVRVDRRRVDPEDLSSKFLPISRGDVIQLAVVNGHQMSVEFAWVL